MVFLCDWVHQNQLGSPTSLRIVVTYIGFPNCSCGYFAYARSFIHAHKSQRSVEKVVARIIHAHF